MNIDGQGGLKNIKEDREETGMNLIVVVKSFLCLFFIVAIDMKKKIIIICNYFVSENAIAIIRIHELAEKLIEI